MSDTSDASIGAKIDEKIQAIRDEFGSRIDQIQAKVEEISAKIDQAQGQSQSQGPAPDQSLPEPQ
jgi:hypothetical protein